MITHSDGELDEPLLVVLGDYKGAIEFRYRSVLNEKSYRENLIQLKWERSRSFYCWSMNKQLFKEEIL